MKIVATSGYFDNLHCGHLESFKMAKQYGDYLIVFVDSDRKAILKKGFVIMPENERAEIIRNIRCVDKVIVVDTSIAEALYKHKPKVFFKGGDRTIASLPIAEVEICELCGIEIIYEGEKIQASSLLLDKTSVIKPWGKYNIINRGLGFIIKKLTIDPDCKISLQYHNNRSEYWTVQKGTANVIVNESIATLQAGESIFVPEKSIHRIMNNTNDIVEIIEVQFGKCCDELDIVRIGDDYGRVKCN